MLGAFEMRSRRKGLKNYLRRSLTSVLFERLEEKDLANLLKILAKRIIVNPDGLIVDQELYSPFTYLRNLADSSGGSYRDSEQVRLGALKKLSAIRCQLSA
jgi:hypothetical protein